MSKSDSAAPFDTSSREEFVQYYEKESLSPATLARFGSIRSRVLALAERSGRATQGLAVLDVGCGAGSQCLMWAAGGHRAYGIDVNAPLIEIARKRAQEAGYDVRFDVGSATVLPYDSETMDVCLIPELLEHVGDWRQCLVEAVRVLRPGGILFVSTTNILCPLQQEYRLPLYSWYPSPLKRYVERLVVTTRPELANYARYPAIHWFSYYGLAKFLRGYGFRCFDRFQMIDGASLSPPASIVAAALRGSAVLRFFAQFCSSGSVVFGLKR